MDTTGLLWPKHRPRVLAVTEKATAKQSKLDKAYRDVETREENKCQVTGVTLTPGARDWKHAREHHHLKGRRVQPTWVTDPKRIVLVSRYVHDLCTRNVLLTDDTDATKPMRWYWNPRLVENASKAPFRLRPSVALAKAVA
jgi:hypothetical protein